MRVAHNSAAARGPEGGYSQAIELRDPRRTLYVSGQIPVPAGGVAPALFGEQCRLAWRNLEAQLVAADMGLDNLVKITTFLADRRYGEENAAIRREALGDRRPALTVVIAGMFNSGWLLEIEAIAAD